MYRTGGLESTDDVKSIEVDGINYVTSDKFKMMLRDQFIDWGTFLEIYHDNLDYVLLFDQIVKLLNIKENENLRESLIPMVESIYKLPAEVHMTSMLKQFIVYEPLSAAIHSLFTTIKLYFESVVEKFIMLRNKYINLNNTNDKINDFDKLIKYWNDLNDQYDLDTSSIILLFLNPPKGFKSGINFNVKGIDAISDLKAAVRKFHYPGFCPKVPHTRLNKLLEFPLLSFIEVIKILDPTELHPNFHKIEEIIQEKLKNMPPNVEIKDQITRETPPKELKDDKLELAKWYVNAILDLRKQLLPYSQQYEEYYVKKAQLFVDINNEIKRELTHLHAE